LILATLSCSIAHSDFVSAHPKWTTGTSTAVTVRNMYVRNTIKLRLCAVHNYSIWVPVRLEVQHPVPQSGESTQNVLLSALVGDDESDGYPVLPLIEHKDCVQGVLRRVGHCQDR
jgi:hypothetical protein